MEVGNGGGNYILDKDGEPRNASVCKSGGKGKPEILNRPSQRLYPLEISNSEQSKNGPFMRKDGSKDREEQESVCRNRSSHATAKDAQWKSKHMHDP